MPPTFLGLDEVLEIHQDQIRRYGGAAGIRDMGLLQSALAMPQAGVQGKYLHADLPEMAATYLFHLVKNHPFVDGNKRVGAVAALVFLAMNGAGVRCTNEDLAGMVLDVARGRIEKSSVAEFLRGHAGR